MIEKEETNQQRQKSKTLADWLEVLQQESWQLELIISGLALYGILGSGEIIDSFKIYVDHMSFRLARGIGDLAYWVAWTAWVIGAINLLAHIFLRGFWIGAVGLRYVSGGIDYQKLDYSPYFQRLFDKRIGNYDLFIESLERACSTIFAYTFLLFFMFLSWCLFLVPMMLPIVLSETISTQGLGMGYSIFLFFYVGVSFLVFFDFVSGGILKRIRSKWFERIYGFIYRVFSTFTMSFLYRPILFNFLDNRYTRKWFFFSFPYIALVAFIIPNLSMNENMFFPTENINHTVRVYLDQCNYDDLRATAMEKTSGSLIAREHCALPKLWADKYHADDEMIQIFIRMNSTDERLLAKNGSIYPFRSGSIHWGDLTNSDSDPEIVRLKKLYKPQIKELMRAKRKERKAGNDESKISEIESRIKVLEEQKNEAIKAHISENAINIMQEVIETHEIRLNDEPLAKRILLSKFMIHPYDETKCVMMLIDISDLENGEHEFQYCRMVDDGPGTEYKCAERSLPFLRIKRSDFNSQISPPSSVQ